MVLAQVSPRNHAYACLLPRGSSAYDTWHVPPGRGVDLAAVLALRGRRWATTTELVRRRTSWMDSRNTAPATAQRRRQIGTATSTQRRGHGRGGRSPARSSSGSAAASVGWAGWVASEQVPGEFRGKRRAGRPPALRAPQCTPRRCRTADRPRIHPCLPARPPARPPRSTLSQTASTTPRRRCSAPAVG
jgi:hypothetical protein